jgi:hypothetical protein
VQTSINFDVTVDPANTVVKGYTVNNATSKVNKLTAGELSLVVPELNHVLETSIPRDPEASLAIEQNQPHGSIRGAEAAKVWDTVQPSLMHYCR